MKKGLCVLWALFFVFASAALAEEGAFLPGDTAAAAAGDRFWILPEAEDTLLARFSQDGVTAAERAEEIRSLVSGEDAVYYLCKTGGAWAIAGRKNTSRWEVMPLEAGREAACLSKRGENFFLLLDGRLHIVYPEAGLALKLADAPMTEYVLVGDEVYYVSAEETVASSASAPEGEISAETGRLYRMNLSTGSRTALTESGASDLRLVGETLYFHNYADAYVQGTGEDARLAGRLYQMNLSTGEIQPAAADYDWGYLAWPGGLLLRRQEGLFWSDAMGETILIPLPEDALAALAGDAVAVYLPGEGAFHLYDLTGALLW